MRRGPQIQRDVREQLYQGDQRPTGKTSEMQGLRCQRWNGLCSKTSDEPGSAAQGEERSCKNIRHGCYQRGLGEESS